MRLFLLLLLGFYCSTIHAQSLPITFEDDVSLADFIDFDGGMADVVDNPAPGGLNTTATVGQIVRDGGAVFAGSKLILDSPLDFSTDTRLQMLVYTTAPVGTVVKFKLEGAGSTERDVTTTVSGAWELLTWDFTGTPTVFNELVFMFDFGNVGDGSAASTFYFDDIQQVFGGAQLDLPVTFDEPGVNYTTTDFDGTFSELVDDPEDATNRVVRYVKTPQAGASSGTTIGTPVGFATEVPLTLDDSKMTVRVWSPTANTPVRLKLEDSDDPTHTVETEARTTVAGQWETLEFDFAQEAPGTAALAFGLTNGWTYNMASIFFNFGTDGQTAGETVYYFDEVRFGDLASKVTNLVPDDFRIFPNPTRHGWTLTSETTPATQVVLYTITGQYLHSYRNTGGRLFVPATDLSAGVYLATVRTAESSWTVRLVRD